MNTYPKDNIVAIASANGYAGVGIIRISGYNLGSIIKSLTRKTDFKPRYCNYCNIYDEDNSILDSAIVIYFVAPNSFTGEEVVEIQCHGSPILLNLVLQRCISLGCRMAEAGEFSKRAYLNQKIDLLQAESIADLIHAESAASVKSAQKSLQGEFSRQINQISETLINLRMFVEASIDFPEEDIEFIQNAKIKEKLALVRQNIHQLLANTKQGVILNNGINLVIIGRPNVGKSSLLNALAGTDIAIVTDVAGTTRDVINQKVIIDGVVFNIIDTAGIRETTDKIEKIGIEKAKIAIGNADICMMLLDSEHGWMIEDNEILQNLPSDLPQIIVHNKIDLTDISPNVKYQDNIPNVYISAQNNLGLDLLRQELLKQVGFTPNENTFIARDRHLNAMKTTVMHIDNGFNSWGNLELLAEELCYAHTSLMSIVGEFSADDLLGEIFSKFCIGK